MYDKIHYKLKKNKNKNIFRKKKKKNRGMNKEGCGTLTLVEEIGE